MDWSTINLTHLRRLPTYTLPPSYHLQSNPGNGCYLDAPGYPSYFTRSVYTRHGNTPRRGPETVISHGGRLYVVAASEDWKPGLDWDAVYAKRQARLHALWSPLPLDHPRTRLWIGHVYQHFAHCYRDAERLEYGKPGTLIYPVPSYKLKHPMLDPHWTDECKAAVLADAEAFNKQEQARAAAIATPENHQAVAMIRRFYPDYTPEPDLIAAPPRLFQADWWERDAERPTPKDCPGHLGTKHGHYDNCRYCGWQEAEEAEQDAAREASRSAAEDEAAQAAEMQP